MILNVYYNLLMIKLMVFDINMPRTIRKFFSFEQGNLKEELTID